MKACRRIIYTYTVAGTAPDAQLRLDEVPSLPTESVTLTKTITCIVDSKEEMQRKRHWRARGLHQGVRN